MTKPTMINMKSAGEMGKSLADLDSDDYETRNLHPMLMQIADQRLEPSIVARHFRNSVDSYAEHLPPMVAFVIFECSGSYLAAMIEDPSAVQRVMQCLESGQSGN